MTVSRRPSLKFGTQTTSGSPSPVAGESVIEAEAYDARMDLGALGDWLERYFAAWESNDPDDVAALFAPDAVYSYGPFRDEARGRDEIVRRWVEGGVLPGLRWSYEALAVEGARGVANWRVSFDSEEGRTELDGILVLGFDERGRCTSHREWYDRRVVPA